MSNVEETKKKLLDLVKKMIQATIDTIDKDMPLWSTYILQNHLTGGTSSTRLKKVTGRLSGSMRPLPTKLKSDGIYGGLEFGTRYAGIHIGRMGDVTTIRSNRPGGYLAIPLEAAKTTTGRTRAAPRDPMWGSTFIAKGIIFGYKGGKVKTAGKIRDIVPLFKLKKSVRVPVRVDALKLVQWIKPKLEKDLSEAIYNVH